MAKKEKKKKKEPVEQTVQEAVQAPEVDVPLESGEQVNRYLKNKKKKEGKVVGVGSNEFSSSIPKVKFCQL